MEHSAATSLLPHQSGICIFLGIHKNKNAQRQIHKQKYKFILVGTMEHSITIEPFFIFLFFFLNISLSP